MVGLIAFELLEIVKRFELSFENELAARVKRNEIQPEIRSFDRFGLWQKLIRDDDGNHRHRDKSADLPEPVPRRLSF